MQRHLFFDFHLLSLASLLVFAPSLHYFGLSLLGVGILLTKVRAKTHYLGVKIRFLQLYCDEFRLVGIRIENLRRKIQTQYPYAALLLNDGRVVAEDVEFENFFTQKILQKDGSRPFVLHHILERRIIYRICYQLCHNELVFFSDAKVTVLIQNSKKNWGLGLVFLFRFHLRFQRPKCSVGEDAENRHYPFFFKTFCLQDFEENLTRIQP